MVKRPKAPRSYITPMGSSSGFSTSMFGVAGLPKPRAGQSDRKTIIKRGGKRYELIDYD